MIVTYQDELGVVSVKIDDEYGVVFDRNRAIFSDENDKDYQVDLNHLISIVKEK